MRLIGMLDSPYVRRVAISLQLLDLRFEHASISVFRQFDAFAAINPVVKAPTLVADDGEVLMESTLILEHAEALAAGSESLMPTDARERPARPATSSAWRWRPARRACRSSTSERFAPRQAARAVDRSRHRPDARGARRARGRDSCAGRSRPGCDDRPGRRHQRGLWQFIQRSSVAALVSPARCPALQAFSESADRSLPFAPRRTATGPIAIAR